VQSITETSGDDAAWPWVLAVLSVLLGGAPGLAPLTSLISVQPLDETGNPTPAWSLKVHVMLVVVALTATVLVLVLVTASAGHLTWLSWVAVPTGVATGAVLAGYLGGIERIPSQRQQRVQHVTDRRAVPQE
jgi:hypothetical protein